MKTRYQKTKTPETKFLNVYIKEEFSRESSISHDSGISEIGSTIRSENKRRSLDFDLDPKIKIKTESYKKCKIETFDESSSDPKKSKLVVNPFAINNKRINLFATNNKGAILSSSNNPKSFKNKRQNSGPLEIKLDVKRFKQEDNITCKVEKPPSSVTKPKQQEQLKCKIANVSSKTFQIKKCSIKIEKCEGLETAKENRSPQLLRGDRRINKQVYNIVPDQFLSLQPKVILYRCQSYTWRTIRDDDWTFPDTEIHNSKMFSGTFNEKITFEGRIKCRNISDGNTFYLITYFPKDVIEDEWMTTEQYENMNFSKTLPLNELKTEAKKKLFENLINKNVTSKKSTRKYNK